MINQYTNSSVLKKSRPRDQAMGSLRASDRDFVHRGLFGYFSYFPRIAILSSAILMYRPFFACLK